MSRSLAPASRIMNTRLAAGVAVVLAFVELVAAVTFQIPIAPLLFAVLLLVSARLIAVRDAAGPVLLAAVCAVELLLLPGYDRLGAVDWAVQGATALLALAGAVCGAVLLARSRPLVRAAASFIR